jgi:transposase
VLALDPRVVGAVWAAVQAHLPDTHPWGCHRRRVEDKICFTAMLTRLVTGCSWQVAAAVTTGVSATTLRARRTEWLAAGVFDKLLAEALAAYDRIIGLDLSEVAVDGSLHKAPGGGEGTGKNPTDRGKLGWKWSIATDRPGHPDRLDHRRRQPQRLRPARTHPARWGCPRFPDRYLVGQAASACWRRSYSSGLIWPRALWRRRALYQPSIQA